jgi:YD repeat-containing protein
MNQGRVLHAADDQFDGILEQSYNGFGNISTRKKPDGGSTEYQYKIDKDAKLYASTQEFTSIIKPKVPGEWIDVTYAGKDLYLYLECIFSITKRNKDTNRPESYKISSATLITTDKQLPSKFSGTFSKQTAKDGYNYYEITLGRRFLSILPFHIQPIQYWPNSNISLGTRNINGITYPSI